MATKEHQLTAKQQECVDYRGNDLLIRGVPGSGKTVVLLRRARKQAEEEKSAGIRVRVFTFNKTLAKYARELVAGMENPHIEVVNFHSWAYSALRKVEGRSPKVIKSKERTALIEQLVDKYKRISGQKSRIFDNDSDFWEDEISWIKGMAIDSPLAYEKAERRGRGTAVRGSDRRLVWAVYELYNRELRNLKVLDWDDFALKLLAAAEEGRLPDEVRIDHILIDEAQDLQAAQLKLLRLLARKSFTVAADEAQKIYKRSFTWRDLGINILGSGSKRLITSFRSTMQIIGLAASLRRFDPAVRAGAEEAIEYEAPSVTGTEPLLYPTPVKLKEEEVVVNLIREIQKNHLRPEPPTIGLLARQWKMLYRMEYLLKDNEIPYETIRDDDGQVTTPGVKLTTFHSAKGLEFDYVILCRLNEGIIPPEISAAAMPEEQEEQLAIERRLLYVSMTRAKFGLYMTYSEQPSRFISEFDSKLYRQITV